MGKNRNRRIKLDYKYINFKNRKMKFCIITYCI